MAQERNNLDRPNGSLDDDAVRRDSFDLSADDERDRETDQIREQIEETRGQMGETIDAIQDKLSFSNLSEQVSEHVNNAVETAKDAVYGATIGKAATFMKNFGEEISKTSIVKTAKDNPFPFILIGLGAGLLVYQNFGKHGSNHTRRQLRSGRKPALSDPTDQTSVPNGETVPGKANGLAETVSNAAGTAYNKVTSAVDSAVSGVGDMAGQAYSKVGDVGTAARDQYDHYIEENPLAVGAVALALGAAVGMALPATRYEEQLMGQARQDLLDKAQNTASDLLDKGRQVVTEAGRVVSEQAKSAISDSSTSDPAA